MAKKDIIHKLKKMMPDAKKKGSMLEISMESPEHEAAEHAPGGPEEGMEDQEVSIPLDHGDGSESDAGDEEGGESPDEEGAEGGPDQEPDLSQFSDDELQAELDKRKAAAQKQMASKPMGMPPKGKY
jgi:hypothetical protein